MNTAVNKATKHDGNFPKQKHVTTLCSYSWESKVSVKNMIDLLGNRLNDSNWDVVFKTLIVLHCIIRDGCSENVLGYLSQCPEVLNVSSFRPKAGSSGMHQIKNIRTYASYLEHKVQIYQRKRVDFAESKSGRGLSLMTDGVEARLIENVTLVQEHLDILLLTKYYEADVDNHISLYSFKMLIRDLLKVFQCANQGVISILKNYFDLDKEKATKCLQLYRNFIQQTEQVIQYLDVARSLESLLQFTVPKLKHAPVSLLASLEEHLRSSEQPIALKQPKFTNVIPILQKNEQASGKKEALDFFASLDDDISLKKYQPPVSPINHSPLNSISNPFGSNSFTNAQKYRSPFDNTPQLYTGISSPNIYTQTAPNFSSLPSSQVAFNPFATLRANNQAVIQQNYNGFSSLRQPSQPTRSTMNPFVMNAFADDRLKSQQLTNNKEQRSNLNFPDFNPNQFNQPSVHSLPVQESSNLISQHYFPAQ